MMHDWQVFFVLVQVLQGDWQSTQILFSPTIPSGHVAKHCEVLERKKNPVKQVRQVN
jgi:hypothetical protein